jgi:hypothetical protein
MAKNDPAKRTDDQGRFASAEACFERLRPAFETVATEQIRQPNIDLQQAAVVALRIDERLRKPSDRARIEAMAAAGKGGHAVINLALIDGLADVAIASWYVRSRVLLAGATHTEAQLPVALIEQATPLRARMLKAIDYNLDHLPGLMAELVIVRSGTGYQDLANDLVWAASAYRKHGGALAIDQKNYRPDDGPLADKTAGEILRLLGKGATAEHARWKDMQARAFTLLSRHYDEAIRVGRFLHFYDEGEAKFPTLASATRSAQARSRGGEGPGSVPSMPAVPAAPATPTSGGAGEV